MTRSAQRKRVANAVKKRNRVASVREPKSAVPARTELEDLRLESAVLRGRAEKSTAERDAALILLGEIVAHVTRVGGYMLPGDQATLRTAKALLVEHGWRTP